MWEIYHTRLLVPVSFPNRIENLELRGCSEPQDLKSKHIREIYVLFPACRTRARCLAIQAGVWVICWSPHPDLVSVGISIWVDSPMFSGWPQIIAWDTMTETISHAIICSSKNTLYHSVFLSPPPFAQTPFPAITHGTGTGTDKPVLGFSQPHGRCVLTGYLMGLRNSRGWERRFLRYGLVSSRISFVFSCACAHGDI